MILYQKINAVTPYAESMMGEFNIATKTTGSITFLSIAYMEMYCIK
jgi:hypothetical protein